MTKLLGVPYRPRFSADEVCFGVVVALVLHAAVLTPLVRRAWFNDAGQEADNSPERSEPRVARPVIQASLLKLGRPLDPSKLPDRLVPQLRSAPRKQMVASPRDPLAAKPDAGAPVANAEDRDLANLIAKSDPFAEANATPRPELGHPLGVEGGQETDPAKVRAGDAYAAQLGQFFAERNQIPTVIAVSEAKRLCVVFEIRINRRMVIWHVREQPVRSSGNSLFDDAARTMLLKLLDDKSPLPAPPREVDEHYRSRTVQLSILGDPHGDPTACN